MILTNKYKGKETIIQHLRNASIKLQLQTQSGALWRSGARKFVKGKQVRMMTQLKHEVRGIL